MPPGNAPEGALNGARGGGGADGRVLDNRFDEPVSWDEVGCKS
jgi:hypothetical protein